MADRRRHAIYFAPRPGPLAAFGAAWLGWDAEMGGSPALDLPGLPRPRPELVAAARRYGFHATLKAPFRLAAGRGEADLDAALSALAKEHAPIGLRLRLAELGTFVALVPARPPATLRRLADACVVRLDAFRAPPDAADVARQRTAGLDADGEAYLRRWGYPYVLDHFRFHMTLTGPLAPGDRATVRAALAPALAPLLADPVRIEDVCRVVEDDAGSFRLAARHPLRTGE